MQDEVQTSLYSKLIYCIIRTMKKIVLSFVFTLFCALAVVAQPRYIFYFIGDGMGPNEVLLAEMYQAELAGKIGCQQLCMTQFPYSGQLSTYSASNSITDSSAAGTALATGEKTNNGMLGVLPDGSDIKSIAEILHNYGWGVGITTSVSIDHATPASFYAHTSSRSNYYEIGQQLLHSGYDFFAGSTFLRPIDNENPFAPSLYQQVEKNDIVIAHGLMEAEKLIGNTKRIILIPENEGHTDDYKSKGMLPYAIDKNEKDLTLPEITDAAIRHLSHQKQFFLMVEGGAIDWACHSNDAATVIGEVREFDEAIKRAFDFYKAHPDETLIVVTADHETGGLALGNSDYTLNLKLLQYQKCSVGELSQDLRTLQKQYGKKLKWEQVKGLLQEKMGFYKDVEITDEEDAMLRQLFQESKGKHQQDVKTLYQQLSKLADTSIELLNKKSKVGWTTRSHSAAAVPVFAVGVGAERFTGWHDNTEVERIMLNLVVGR